MQGRAILAAFWAMIWTTTVSIARQQAPGQEAPFPEVFEGRTVSRVDIALSPYEDLELAKRLIVQQAGKPLSREAIAKSVEALEQYQQFRQVQVRIEPVAEGVRVAFLLEPVFRLGLVSFPGAARKITYTRLLQVVHFSPDEPFIASEIPEREQALKDFLTEQGYFAPTIHTTWKADDVHRLVNVIFECDLGRPAEVGDIQVLGVSAEESGDIQRTLRSLRARISGASLKTGQTYSRERIDRALDRVRNHLRQAGRLAPSLRVKSSYDAATNRVFLELMVAPGPVVSVRLEGARLSRRTLRRLIPIYQEGTVDQDLIEEGRRNLVSHFQGNSYFDVSVRAEEESEDDQVTVTYSVDTGRRHRIANIVFTNNQFFSNRQLQRKIAIQSAGFPFRRGRYSEALLAKSTESLEALYRQAGFSSVRIATKVRDNEPNIDIEFIVSEGAQDHVRRLEFVDEKGNPVPREVETYRHLLSPGQPYSSYRVNQDRNQILAAYLNRGYPDVQLDVTATPSQENPHEIDLTYTLKKGRLVRIGDVVLLGTERTRPEFARTAIAKHVQEGQPLGPGKLLQTDGELYSLGIFDWASVTPGESDENTNTRQVLVRVHESKCSSLDIGGGIEVISRNGNVPAGTVVVPGIPPISLGEKFIVSQETFFGPLGSLQFIRRNIRGVADTATLGIVASRLDQEGAFTYEHPGLFRSRWSSLLSVTGERSTENPIFTSVTGQASFQVETKLDKRKTQTLIVGYTYGRTDLTDVVIPELVLPQDRHVRISSFYAEWIRDTRDNPPDAHHGTFESLSTLINSTALGASANFVKVLGQTSFYLPLRGWLTWANNLRLGLMPPFAGSSVPLSERFFSGGPESLRGFAINDAGPQRPVEVCKNPAELATCNLISVPVGGEMLAIFNSELRFPIPIQKQLGGVIFYDGGNVYNKISLSQFASNYTNTVGIGFRYKTKVGPIRVDIARNLTPMPGLRATQYFVTVGQAF